MQLSDCSTLGCVRQEDTLIDLPRMGWEMRGSMCNTPDEAAHGAAEKGNWEQEGGLFRTGVCFDKTN